MKLDIVEVGRRLYNKGFVASNDGNISIRISDSEIIITPTGVSKGFMNAADLITVNLDGNVISGGKKPSSEMKMHLAVYRKRPDVKAVVHAHPQKATAFAVANLGFEKITLPEVVFSLGCISLAEYGTPTTYEVPEAVGRHIGGSDALLLANHGALTVGSDVYDAYYKMETLEHFASISLYARSIGGEKALDARQTDELFRVRREVYGKNDTFCTGCGACGKGGGRKGYDPENSAGCIAQSINSGAATDRMTEYKDEAGLREAVRKIVMSELVKLSGTR